MNKVSIFRKITAKIITAAICFVAAFAFVFALPQHDVSASAEAVQTASSTAAIVVHKYDADVEIHKDRTVDFHEKITVEFTKHLPSGASTYYRSLPVDGGERYFNLSAKCDGNADFSYSVANNPDIDGFIDINCTGGVAKGKTWTYEFFYTLLPAKAYKENGMILDVVGFGSSVAMQNVDVTVHLPAAYTEAEVYSSSYGKSENLYVDETWKTQSDKTTIVLHADQLPLSYNNTYGENMAVGVTLAFVLPSGVFESFASTRVTGSIWAVVLVGILLLGAAIAITVFCRKKKDIVRVVSVKPPKNLDPLRMGKLIDGKVDNEDVTSMIYWFASQGYLTVDLTDDTEPILRKVKDMPENSPSYQQTLFDGLFINDDEVKVSDLSEKYYKTVDEAKHLVSAKDVQRYENKSTFALFACAALAFLYWIFCPLLIGRIQMGGGYTYWGMGLFTLLPVGAVCLLLKVREDRRYKDNAAKRTLWLIAAAAVGLIVTFVYLFIMHVHVISRTESVIICIVSLALCCIGVSNLSLTDGYAKTLGDILGFKDFIVYTEKDKIEFMLSQNPELYYDILPYAQVLGVTDAWTNKFKGLTIEPPTWATGDFSVFDYLLFRNIMRSAMITMTARPQPKSGGTFIGRSGGGGGFGGFSGGGAGGGGFGVR